MLWTEGFSKISRCGFRSLASALFALACVGLLAHSQSASGPSIQISDKPMSGEQLAVYKAVLNGWMEDGRNEIHLSIETIPFGSGIGGEANCGKSLQLEAIAPGEVHRFRQEDLAQLGPGNIGLVDAKKQEREVAKNDPGKRIREGDSVGQAVANGFAHGLVTLGEIRFDKDHTHALVWYGFRCGSLCGNGGVALLEKKDGVWRFWQRCSNWIS